MTKEELLNTVWPDTCVSDGVLRFCLRELRKALRDDPRAPRFIETVHKRGYRFIGKIDRQQSTVEPSMYSGEGRSYEQVVRELRRAADKALRRSDHQGAIHYLTTGLEFLNTLPDTRERARQELALYVTLAHLLRATKGFAAPEVQRIYVRARELWQRMGETAHLFPVLWGLAAGHAVRAELRAAREVGGQLVGLAQRIQDPALLLETHTLYGSVLVWLGDLPPGRTHLEQALALYDPQRHSPHAFLYGQDPGVVCQANTSYALWLLGYPDQALKRSHEALALAHQLSHPHSLAYALNWVTMLHQFRLESRKTKEWAEKAAALSREQGFAHLLAVVVTLQGWALVGRGHRQEGVALLQESVAAWQTTGAELLRPYYLALLAEGYAKGGQMEEGLATLAAAFAVAERTEERWWEAELYRLKGELTLQQSRVQGLASRIANPQHPTPDTLRKAETCFLKAIEVARRQQAKSLELRAVISLSRLWQRQGKTKEARQMLEEIYSWFTEGFDSVDHKQARALLKELL